MDVDGRIILFITLFAQRGGNITATEHGSPVITVPLLSLNVSAQRRIV